MAQEMQGIERTQEEDAVFVITLLRMLADQVEERGLVGTGARLHVDRAEERDLEAERQSGHNVNVYKRTGEVSIQGSWHLAPEPEAEDV